MRQAITTRYLEPTNSRESRIKAIARKANPRCEWPEQGLTIPYDYGNDDQHARAAKALTTKLGWDGLWVAGGKPEEDGNVYVNIPLQEQSVGYAGWLDLRGEGSDWFFVSPREGA